MDEGLVFHTTSVCSEHWKREQKIPFIWAEQCFNTLPPMLLGPGLFCVLVPSKTRYTTSSSTMNVCSPSQHCPSVAKQERCHHPLSRSGWKIHSACWLKRGIPSHLDRGLFAMVFMPALAALALPSVRVRCTLSPCRSRLPSFVSPSCPAGFQKQKPSFSSFSTSF